MTRPAKLQINQSGAWRDVLRFDIDQLVNEAAFLEAADKMMRSTGSMKTMRIVSDESLPGRLMYWNAEHGWKPDGNTPASAAEPVPNRPKTLAGASGPAEADAAPKTLKSKGA